MKAANTIVTRLTLAAGFALAWGCDTAVEALGSTDAKLIAPDRDNPELCPETPSQEMRRSDDAGPDADCSGVPAGTLCVYGIPNGWAGYVCGCYTDNLWQRIGSSGPGACPTDAPIQGSACDPSVVLGPCPYYPDVLAQCEVDQKWQVWQLDSELSCPNLETVVR